MKRLVSTCVGLLATLAISCATAEDPDGEAIIQPKAETASADIGYSTRVHIMPMSDGIKPLAQPINAATSAHLTYYGGPVLQHVKVVQVNWGTGVNYATFLSQFYTDITNSTYFDWLSEYNTTSPAQSIGRGTFGGAITDTAVGSGSSITDAQIQTEISNRISDGTYPAPTADTIYMMHFPPGKSITASDGSQSCVQFCAYHGTFTRNGQNIYYGVLPDLGGSCAGGCGTASQQNNTTSVASHELIEAVTDAAVGIATVIGPPLAWYDQTNGEIGDICNAQQGSVTSNGTTYTVQKEWSNAQNACVVSGPSTPPPTNDFSISASPTSLTVAAGSSGSATISTAVVSGSAGTVSLAVSGLPTGVTANLASSVTAGGSATLTLTASSSAAAASATVKVTGTEGSATHSVNIALTVTSTTPPPPGGITNGGFETGDLSGWTPTGSAAASTNAKHSGSYAALVGSTNPTGDSSISQTFTAPTGATTLSFWYKMTCPDTVTYDWATASLKDNTSGTTSTILSKTCATNSSFVQVTATVTAGHSYTLTLTNHDDNYTGDASYTYFDDVAFGTGGTGGGTVLNVTNISGATGSWHYYTVNVPAGATNLKIAISGGSGDCDLYVKFGSQPTLSSYDYRPYLYGNNESVTVTTPQAGTYYIGLNGYQTYSGVTLTASYQ